MYRKLVEFAGGGEVGKLDSDIDSSDESKEGVDEDESDEAEQQIADADDCHPEAKTDESDDSDDYVEYQVPKIQSHSLCRLCPEATLKSETEVEAHLACKVHNQREREYYRIQRQFNLRHFGVHAEESEETEESDAVPKASRPSRDVKAGTKREAIDGSSGDTQSPPIPVESIVRCAGARVENGAAKKRRTRKALSEEKIHKLKAKFQAKKSRRLTRKTASSQD